MAPTKTDGEQWQPSPASVMAQYKKMILALNGHKKKRERERKSERERERDGGRQGNGGEEKGRAGREVIHLQIRLWRSGLFQAASGCQELTR